MTLEIQCNNCQRKFHVEGYTTPDSFYEPGEVVTELESMEPLCECLNDCGEYMVLSEDIQCFDDDVI